MELPELGWQLAVNYWQKWAEVEAEWPVGRTLGLVGAMGLEWNLQKRIWRGEVHDESNCLDEGVVALAMTEMGILSIECKNRDYSNWRWSTNSWRSYQKWMRSWKRGWLFNYWSSKLVDKTLANWISNIFGENLQLFLRLNFKVCKGKVELVRDS